MENETRKQLLADIATLYYKEKKTQEQIAAEFGYSRSAISRFLSEAEENGIVEIHIKNPLLRVSVVENHLIDEFRLNSAFVINAGKANDSGTLQMVGRLGANFLEKELKNDMVVGMGWGTSLHELVNSLPFLPLSGVRVIQVIGASGSKSDTRIDGPDLAASLAVKLNAEHQFLHSPLLLDTEEACRTLKSQKQIKETLSLAKQADLVLLGIGTVNIDPRYSSIFRAGYLDKNEILDIQEKGAVANFCGVIIDQDGKIMDLDINRRVMSVDLPELKKSNRKIVGIAAGIRKSSAVLSVLKGGWLDVLITDQEAVSFMQL
jgi:DNA-binding transcriptional regulator LsrR (DeoR family)